MKFSMDHAFLADMVIYPDIMIQADIMIYADIMIHADIVIHAESSPFLCFLLPHLNTQKLSLLLQNCSWFC
jgi:hypothetical protein